MSYHSDAYWLYRDDKVQLRTGSRDKMMTVFNKQRVDFPNSYILVTQDTDEGRCIVHYHLPKWKQAA